MCVNGMVDAARVPVNLLRATANLQRALVARMEADSRLQCAENVLGTLSTVDLDMTAQLSHPYIRMRDDAPVPREVLARMATIVYIRAEMPRAEKAREDAQAALKAADAALAQAIAAHQAVMDALA